MNPSPSVFESDQVRQVRMLHAPIIRGLVEYQLLSEQMELFAGNLWKYFQDKDPAVAVELRNYHPKALGLEAEEILGLSLTEDDMRMTIAREYGFNDWEAMKTAGDRTFDPEFEMAVSKLLAGDLPALRLLLQDRPYLVHAHSPYGHGAGLVHYLAANGTEIWRQQVPENAAKIAALLLEMGADPQQEHHIYGGGISLADLIRSSTHIQAAGLEDSLLNVILPNQ